ncbi:hypothetical protein EJ04DRAFT_134178 [Polyplosphaeria fusca]|uniref:Uncharacterized protein n=1 Tax=Polyplosphaeria fusca TaxID=682080 RepID=A0A9P4R1Q0_9PLEO|nr:hypothetical protein EJ04DRAFT_134178 [Polyplosphaeria fusca]
MAFAFAQNPFVIHPALVSPPELPTIDLEEAWKHPPLPSHQTILRYEIRQAEIAINHITDGEERGPIIPSPEEIDRQEKVSRFETLLTDALTLIRTQGAYTIFGYTQFVPWPAPAPALNTFYIQRSFTCAQKLLIEDRKLVQMSMTRAAALETFDRLWEVTIQLVDTLVETGVLTFEAWVWGVYGLTPGYRELDRDFDALKTRMQKGLKGLAGEQTIEEVWARERTRAGRWLCLMG